MRIGLIADTHGFLGRDVLAAFSGCDRILHAGDVGDGVLGPLATVAPLVAVAGNNDTIGEASLLPGGAALELEGHHIAVVHRLVDAPLDGWDVLVYGHCHKPHDDESRGRRLLNPGAAGRRGFHRERSVAILELATDMVQFTLVPLGPRNAAR